jgi:hypothetical protein
MTDSGIERLRREGSATPVRAVVLDIGETVLDDTREWNAWADWIGVGRHTFSTVLEAVTASGRDNAETFRYFKPDFDVAAERQRREDYGSQVRWDNVYRTRTAT